MIKKFSVILFLCILIMSGMYFRKLVFVPQKGNAISESSTFSIRFLDVGQADASLIECDGHYMLIDGGSRSSSGKIYTVLKEAGINHLEIIVGTHVDEDHIGGLSGALNYATADRILCTTTKHDTEAFKDFAKYAKIKGGGISIPEIGDIYSLGSAKITILGINAGNENNDSSIILKIEYGDTTYLFTGDAEQAAEQQVLNSGADLLSTVLKVGHHGSADSTTQEFLDKVKPQYAIISVGAGNTYFHPADVTLNKLEAAEIKVYRTDLQGEIKLTSDGKHVDITTEHENIKEDEITRVLPTEGADYVLNIKSKKFHYPFCISVSQMKEKNAIYYQGTREEVLALEYEPCGNCHP